MDYSVDTTVGALVTNHYKVSDVLTKYGIDFCRGGHKTISEVCLENNIPFNRLKTELDKLLRDTPDTEAIDYKDLAPGLLCDYIVNKHHKYIEDNIQPLILYLKKIANVHAEKHPELKEVLEVFRTATSQLVPHMKKEELLLFPRIKQISKAKNHNALKNFKSGTIQTLITKMHEEHNFEEEALRKIASLTNYYNIPDDACTTYRITLLKLAEFEKDLQLHIHIENHVLFPKAIAMERTVFSS